jgi:hypothetical protein
VEEEEEEEERAKGEMKREGSEKIQASERETER